MLIVIGGGIAGTSAAIRAAQADLPVMLIEAGTYPRHKVCGEFLSPEAVNYFTTLGALPAIEAEQPARLTRVRVTSAAGGEWTGALTHTGAGLGLSRHKLDQLLIDRARAIGVHVVTGQKVTGVSGNLTEGFTVTMRGDSIRARAVIAAHGKRTALDRVLNRSFMAQPQPYVGLKAHFRGAVRADTVDLHAFPGGYCGVSRIEAGLVNVCLLVRLETFKRGESIPAFVQWMQRQNRHLMRFFATAEQVTGWLSISQVPFNDHDKQPVEQDILMVGDAAGMIAPLAGDGMSMALHSGLLAADHITRYLWGESDAVTLKRLYTTAWREQFAARIRLGRWLQASLFRPALLSAVLTLINAAPALGQYFVRQTRAPAHP